MAVVFVSERPVDADATRVGSGRVDGSWRVSGSWRVRGKFRVEDPVEEILQEGSKWPVRLRESEDRDRRFRNPSRDGSRTSSHK